eukprot:g4785.t1
METDAIEINKTALMDVDTAAETKPEQAAAAASELADAGDPADPADPTPGGGSSSTSTSDSDDDTETSGDGGGGGSGGDAAAKKTNSKTPEEKLIKAVGYKDKGNACIASGDSAVALKHYERGIKIVETLGTDDQAKALLLSLRLNLALACTKEERYFDAVGATTKVLEVDAANVKALFRRGVARARLGSLEDAKADLLAVIKADPRNGGAKKELKLVRDRLVEHRKKEKASYGGLFDKGHTMYDDKEAERQKREAEKLKRLKEEEEEWGKANEQRKIDGKEEQTLEDWRKEKKEAEDKAKKEREEKEKLKPRPAPPAPPKTSKKDGGGEGGDGDEMELDEDDLKIIQDTKKQGYCYFKRTLSEQDQKLLDAEQMKLRARVEQPSTIPEKENGGAAEKDDVRSPWNNAGTWEEVEKTEWCKGKLTEALSKVTVTAGKDARSDPEFLLEKLGGFDFASAAGEGAGAGKGLEALSQLKQTLAKLRASVTNVEIVEADARVICVSNKTKHLFEFNVKVNFSLTVDESMGLPPQAEGEQAGTDAGSIKTYKGTLEFPDMTNADVDNGRFEADPELKWDKGPRWESTYDDRVKECVADLKAGLLSALGVFFVEYKSS